MCGIFGYIGRCSPDRQKLKEVAYLASTRGCHSHGIAYVDKNGQLKSKKGMGKINTENIFLGVDSNIIIGHCRLSTSGEATIGNCQPLMSGTMAIVHNGSIRNYREVAQRLNVKMQTDCDSEIILEMYKRRATPRQYIGDNAYALALIDGRTITIERSNIPLYFQRTEHGTYFCSRKFEGADVFPNNSKSILTI